VRASFVLLSLLAAGCHDWDQFTVAAPDGMNACPYAATPPDVIDASCRVYTFDTGIDDLEAHASALGSQFECGMLKVQVPGRDSHDLWVDDIGAFKLEAPARAAGTLHVRARFHASIDPNQPGGQQDLVGVYLRQDGLERYAAATVQNDSQPNGPREHNFLFTTGLLEDFNDTSRMVKTGATPDQYDLEVLWNTTGVPQLEFSANGDFSAHVGAAVQGVQRTGIAIGNCCGSSAPPFTAYLDWMITCPK
jgi:hypothetical protein